MRSHLLMPIPENIGDLVVGFAARLEGSGIQVLYLRNHEHLPDEVGNDVDVMISKGATAKAVELLHEFVRESPWRIFNIVEFGPVSIFLHHGNEQCFLHIDLFERLDWHCVPLADCKGMLARRIWNGFVHRPQAEDEIYLNVITRLAYQGVIREKHRIQAESFFALNQNHRLEDIFASHFMGPMNSTLSGCVERAEWQKLENEVTKVRKALVRNALIHRPASTFLGIWKYLKRSVKRAINPPGLFVVFEGPDGVGKSTLIDLLIPTFDGLSGRKDTMIFHWKPTKKSVRTVAQTAGPSQDPRGRARRSFLPSLVFLAYHWLGFWLGYIRYIYPARIKNRAVIGDRYSYEFLLDPCRLRLTLPDWLLKLAAHTTCRPQLVVALTADARTVHGRKPELSLEEITTYQNKLLSMADGCSNFAKIDTSGSPAEIASAIYQEITGRFGGPT